MSEKRIEAVRTGSSTDPCCCTECYPCIGEWGCVPEESEFTLSTVTLTMTLEGTFSIEGTEYCPEFSQDYSVSVVKPIERVPYMSDSEGDTYELKQCVGRPCTLWGGVYVVGGGKKPVIVVPDELSTDPLDDPGTICRLGYSINAFLSAGFSIGFSCQDGQYAISLNNAMACLSRSTDCYYALQNWSIPYEETVVLLGTSLEDILGITTTWSNGGFTVSVKL